MNKVKIVRVSKKLQTATLKELAELYCSIWMEHPWNEDFWTVEGVVNDILTEMKRPCAEAYLAFANSVKIVGFTWGFEVSENDLQKIAGTDALNFLFAEQRKVFYVDELGVASDFRKHGVGEKLSMALIKTAENHGIARIILRTDVKALEARNLYTRIGFQDLSIRDASHSGRTYWLLDIV